MKSHNNHDGQDRKTAIGCVILSGGVIRVAALLYVPFLHTYCCKSVNSYKSSPVCSSIWELFNRDELKSMRRQLHHRSRESISDSIGQYPSCSALDRWQAGKMRSGFENELYCRTENLERISTHVGSNIFTNFCPAVSTTGGIGAEIGRNACHYYSNDRRRHKAGVYPSSDG